MKLKLVVASMSVLGLLSSAVYADHGYTKNKKHHKVRHHRVHVAQTRVYKDTGAMPVMVQAVDNHQMIYDAMSQNMGRSRQAMPDWFNRIGVAGGVNFDAHWGNRSQGYEGENVARLSLNDAYINVGATVNDWTKAFVSFSYSNPSVTSSVASASGLPATVLGGQYSNVYAPSLDLEQGYVTLANYDDYPVFLQVGKQFTDYGRYQIHPLTRTLTQVMTESLQTSAKLGFITPMGLHGDISAFGNNVNQFNQAHAGTVYTAALGYDQINDQLGFDVGVGYMSNLTGVNDIASAIGNVYVVGGAATTYHHTVGGVAVYGDVNSGPFNLGARYTSAIQNFNQADLSTVYGVSTASGAKPWAADVTAGFNFSHTSYVYSSPRNQNIYVGYQVSGNAVNLALPKNRYIAGYNVDVWKATTLGVEFAHDTAYSTSHGGSGNSSNTIGARASVKFG
jgi:hypothetical protein